MIVNVDMSRYVYFHWSSDNSQSIGYYSDNPDALFELKGFESPVVEDTNTFRNMYIARGHDHPTDGSKYVSVVTNDVASLRTTVVRRISDHVTDRTRINIVKRSDNQFHRHDRCVCMSYDVMQLILINSNKIGTWRLFDMAYEGTSPRGYIDAYYARLNELLKQYLTEYYDKVRMCDPDDRVTMIKSWLDQMHMLLNASYTYMLLFLIMWDAPYSEHLMDLYNTYKK